MKLMAKLVTHVDYVYFSCRFGEGGSGCWEEGGLKGVGGRMQISFGGASLVIKRLYNIQQYFPSGICTRSYLHKSQFHESHA